MVKRVIVIGGGTGGTLLVNLLGRKLRSRIKGGEAEVLLISDGFRHYFQPGNLDIAFRGVPPDVNSRGEPELLTPAVNFVPDPCAKINLAERTVTTQGRTTYGYDMVVLATGATPSPELIPGLKEGSFNFHASPRSSESIWERLRGFRRGKVIVAIAGLPYKYPPSPDEALFMLDDYFKRKGIRKEVDLSFLTPYSRSYPSESIARVVDPIMEEHEVEVVPLFNVESVDPAKKQIHSRGGDEVSYDLMIGVPPHVGASVVRASGISDENGWIPVDKQTLRVKGHDDAYAIGDATDIPISKSGVAAHLEAKAVAETLVWELGGERAEARYNGRTDCPIELGGRRAIFVSTSYDTPVELRSPSLLRYAMKRGFARLYWSTITGNMEWLIDAYFGRTTEKTEQPLVIQD